ncbi:hypothetical protein ABH917_003336 [Thermobifida halotolerans]
MGAKVNVRGELTELKFHTQKYRQMAPAELATAIMDVVERARDQMAARVAKVYGQFAPEGIDLNEVMSGRFNPSQMLGKFDLPFLPGMNAPGDSDHL